MAAGACGSRMAEQVEMLGILISVCILIGFIGFARASKSETKKG
jgi:hypothetical protein